MALERAGSLRVEERVRLALELSYAALPPTQRQLFRLLALHPGQASDV